jgi:RimJ/RimL family protein N-acetyltransferase
VKNKFAKFETDRLIFREYTPADLSSVIAGLNNYNVAKWTPTPFPYTAHDAEMFYKNMVPHPNNENLMHFAIIEKDTGKFVGGSSIERKDDIVTGGGIWLDESIHGKGYGTDAWRGRAKWCFENLGVKEIESTYFFDNTRSAKLHAKTGFKPTGKTVKKFCPARGADVDSVVTVLKKADFSPPTG